MTTVSAGRDLTDWEQQHLDLMRRYCKGSDEGLNEVDMLELTLRSLPEAGPCPAFCTRHAGHGWVEDDPRTGEPGRYHAADLGQFSVSQFETSSGGLLPPEASADDLAAVTDPRALDAIARDAQSAAAALRQMLGALR